APFWVSFTLFVVYSSAGPGPGRMASAPSRTCSWYFASSERISLRRSLWRSVRSIDAAGGRIAIARATRRMTGGSSTRAAESAMKMAARMEGERREKRSGHLVAARIDVADLRPRIIPALTEDPAPERERDLDPVLEYECRAGLECDHRGKDQREGCEAEAAERPKALGPRGNR